MRRMLAGLTAKIQDNPKDAKALCARGIIYQHLSNMSGAVADFTQAIDADPSSVDAYCYRFIAYMQVKDFPQALNDANTVIKFTPMPIATGVPFIST
jgi:tetratricopeptide (TPR) repeat protein